MDIVFLWMNAHRTLAVATVMLSLWATAYFWYFRRVINPLLTARQPHRWTVDMVTKTATRNGKTELR